MRQSRIHGLEILLDHRVSLNAVGLANGLFDAGDRLVAGQHARQSEKAGLQYGVGAVSEANLLGNPAGVDHEKLQILIDDGPLYRLRQMVPHRLGSIGRVQEENGAGGREPENVLPLEEMELVAADEIRRGDQIRRMNRARAE